MIPEKLHELIPLYVLGELEPGDAAVLEAMMVRSPELREEVRAYVEALAGVAVESADKVERADAMWAAIERRVRSPHVDPSFATAGSSRPAGARAEVQRFDSRRNWRAWAWPAAAAILLVLNLAQFWWPREPRRDDSPAVARAGRSRSDRGNSPAAPTGDAESASSSDAMNPAANATSREAGASPAEASLSLEEKYEKLLRDFTALSETVVPVLWETIAEQRGNLYGTGTNPRVWPLELHGATSGQPQTVAGMWDRVRQLVPENGVAVLPDRWRLAGGVVIDPGLWTGSGTATPPGLAAGNGQDVGGDLSPYAMTLINGAEGLGYLDLYNLPEVESGREMRLWLQAEGQTDFSPVGTVPPSLVGGSGGLVFRVPPSTAQPDRVLITIEPVGRSSQPTGPVVIEGP